MPIKISQKIKKELPEKQRKGLEQYLWKKSGGKCFLCGQVLNRTSEQIEADHDVPTSNKGKTTRENLNLTHSKCNRFKRNNPSIKVRPYLRFYSFLEARKFDVQYGDCLEFFDLKPRKIHIEWESGRKKARIHFTDEIRAIDVISERVGKNKIYFTFVEVPRDALWNDDECQPRTIKPKQVLSLYSDILTNPLHEPPGCRISSTRKDAKILMFDGQHKTVACWLAGREKIVVKLYLSFSKEQAIRLVNSVQSRIKKLPLSSFELASKLEEEWSLRFDVYLNEVGPENASEQGFLDWIERDERPRAKSALEAAVIKSVIENPDLAVTDFIERPGVQSGPKALIKETAFQNKIVKQLVDVKPRSEIGEEGTKIRNREIRLVTSIINEFASCAFDPHDGAELSVQEQERRKRLSYQAALIIFSKMIKQAVAHLLVVQESEAFTAKAVSTKNQKEIMKMVKKFIEHPIWTVKLDGASKLRAVDDALRKNQNVEKAFTDVGLTVGYLRGADSLSNDWWE